MLNYNFTCCDGVLFSKEAQTLFQHKLGKQKTFGLLQSEKHLPRINVFWTLVKDLTETLISRDRQSQMLLPNVYDQPLL